MELNVKIYVAGHNGLVGSAIIRKLNQLGYTNIITKTSKELDLRIQNNVLDFFKLEKPEYVFLAAAKVGGIKSNSLYKGEFIYDNLMIQTNIINAARLNNVKKLLFLASSCIYPKMCPQPIKEEYLLSGYLEESNDAYAIAKITGIKMCQSYNQQYGTNYISVMPTNLYGPNDSYDLDNSHVLPALMRKILVAKRDNLPFVEIWGNGTPKREFLHSEDLADACIFLMNNYNSSDIINIGTGEDISIKELAKLICDLVGYNGNLTFNTSMPDGTPQKVLDVSKINNIGWKHKISLIEGIKRTLLEIKDNNW
jgi:GDP-L-fucose synthase